MKIPLLATATAVGSTVMVPSPPAGQTTLTGDEVTGGRVTSGWPWVTSVAVKLAGPADPGGVARTTSMNVLAPGYSTTLNCVPVAPAGAQSEFGQVRSEDDGGDAVQPLGMDKVTMIAGGGEAAALKLKVSIAGCEATTVPGNVTVSVPGPAWTADPAVATAGQARATAPTTATATAPTPYHRRDRHMPAPTREKPVRFLRGAGRTADTPDPVRFFNWAERNRHRAPVQRLSPPG